MTDEELDKKLDEELKDLPEYGWKDFMWMILGASVVAIELWIILKKL